MSEAGLGRYRERRPFKDPVWRLWEVSSGRACQVGDGDPQWVLGEQ